MIVNDLGKRQPSSAKPSRKGTVTAGFYTGVLYIETAVIRIHLRHIFRKGEVRCDEFSFSCVF